MLSTTVVSLLGRRTAVSISERALVKDADGFDDIDAFWDAAKTRLPLVQKQQQQQNLVLVPFAQTPAPPTQASSASSKRRRTTPYSRDDWSPDLIADDKVPPSARGRRTPPVPKFTSSPAQPPSVVQQNESEDDQPVVDDTYDEDEQQQQEEEEDEPPPPPPTMEEEEEEEVPEEEAPPLSVRRERSEEDGVRRSHRVKYPPLKYWKNERLIYHQDSNTMAPKVVAVQLGPPTPHPKRRLPQRAEPVRESRFFCEVKGETAMVWDQTAGELREYPAVARSSSLVESRLPVTSSHRSPQDATGMAAQAFNCGNVDLGKEYGRLPPLISGHVTLPPGAVKDEESVGPCTQIFFVASGQREALELALARDPFADFDPPLASRFLLSPGDQFHVPPFNVYRLENRSTTTHLHLFWLIVKPLQHHDDDGSAVVV